jgi:hypothetical protein
LRWGTDRVGALGQAALLDRDGPGSARLCPPDARLIFSCGWHITRDGQDVYPASLKRDETLYRWIGRLTRMIDIDDQVEACRRIFASQTRWTVVRGSDLEEGESQGLPVWSRHVGDPILASNLTRRVDYALFMVAALENDELIHEAPPSSAARRPRRWRISRQRSKRDDSKPLLN